MGGEVVGHTVGVKELFYNTASLLSSSKVRNQASYSSDEYTFHIIYYMN